MLRLDIYLHHIHLNNFKIENDFATLIMIVSHHLYHCKYQNTYLYLQGKKPLSQRLIPILDENELLEKMVVQKQHGFCFQNAHLLAAVLIACGFNVRKHLSKTIYKNVDSVNAAEVANAPFAHAVLVVDLAGKKYLIDTGMAINGLRAPLEIKEGEQRIGNDIYQIEMYADTFRLLIKIPKGWLCLHQTAVEPATHESFVQACTNLFTSSENIKIRDDFLILGMVSETKRKQLIWYNNNTGFFKSIRNDSSVKKYVDLCSYDDVIELANQKYGVKLPKLI